MSETGLYRRGGRNTTSEEVDIIEDKIEEFSYRNKQTISDELLDIINKISNRAYEDGVKSK